VKKPLWVVLFYILTAVATISCTYWGSRAITVLSENQTIRRQHCIIIDPGHGGVDGGATSCSGKKESEYNLEISHRLNDLLHLLGYDTRMIRTTDISVYTEGETIARKKVSDLKERVRIINETENALLLSIHQNNFSDSRYRGAQVFFAGTEGSQAFAEQLQGAFVSYLNPGSTRLSKKSSGVYLMEHIQCPGVLIECGFLSNPEEDALLRLPQYQKKLCCVISSLTSQFISNT